MSGDWAKIELNTPDKPEVWQIAEQLDIDPDAAFGKVFRVWAWFDEHTEEGNAPSVTKRLLDRQVGVTGFCDAMLQAGWMAENDDQISLPNFDKHNGNTAKKRANTNRRVSQHRENKEKNQCNAEGVTKTVTREEKRREENIKDKKIYKRRLPDDFELPQPWIDGAVKYWASKQRTDLDPQDQFSRFKAHHLAKGTTSTDFKHNWKTWYCNAIQYSKPQGGIYGADQPGSRQDSSSGIDWDGSFIDDSTIDEIARIQQRKASERGA